jgi:hypothetical protein
LYSVIINMEGFVNTPEELEWWSTRLHIRSWQSPHNQ